MAIKEKEMIKCKSCKGTGEVQPNRSDGQNRALHLWFTQVAKELNAGGYTVQLVLKEKIDLDWSLDLVKEMLWRPAQIAILNKKSTTSLKKVEDIDVVWEHLNRHIGEKFGIHVPFPDIHLIGGYCGKKECPKCPR